MLGNPRSIGRPDLSALFRRIEQGDGLGSPGVQIAERRGLRIAYVTQQVLDAFDRRTDHRFAQSGRFEDETANDLIGRPLRGGGEIASLQDLLDQWPVRVLAVLAAVGTIALAKAENLLKVATLTTSLFYESLCARASAFRFDDVHQIRRHQGQIEIAQWLKVLLDDRII